AHHNLARVLGDKGQIDNAIKEFKETIRLKKDFSLSHADLGVCLFKKGQLDEAIAEIKEAIRIEPNRDHFHYNLGIAFRDKGLLAETIGPLREAIRLNPNHVDAHRSLADLLATAADPKLRDTKEAVKLARKAVELAPSDALAWQSMGWVLYFADAWKESIEA